MWHLRSDDSYEEEKYKKKWEKNATVALNFADVIGPSRHVPVAVSNGMMSTNLGEVMHNREL